MLRMLRTQVSRHTANGSTTVIVAALVFVALQPAIVADSCGSSAQLVRCQWEVEADKAWPRPEILADYQDILHIYRWKKDGKCATARLSKLTHLKLRIAPDGVRSDAENYYTLYLPGRRSPTLTLLRHLSHELEKYAMELAEEGRTADSLSALKVDIDLACQTVRAEPTDQVIVLEGLSLLRDAWNTVAKVMRMAGQDDRAKEATAHAEMTRAFFIDNVKPLIDKSVAEDEMIAEASEEENLFAQVLEAERKRLHELEALRRRWEETCAVSCGRIPQEWFGVSVQE